VISDQSESRGQRAGRDQRAEIRAGGIKIKSKIKSGERGRRGELRGQAGPCIKMSDGQQQIRGWSSRPTAAAVRHLVDVR